MRTETEIVTGGFGSSGPRSGAIAADEYQAEHPDRYVVSTRPLGGGRLELTYVEAHPAEHDAEVGAEHAHDDEGRCRYACDVCGRPVAAYLDGGLEIARWQHVEGETR